MARILVVDDDDAIRQLLTDALEIEGYDVTAAADGRAAVQLVAVSRPDFVVLDVMMPHLDGYSVLREIRAQPGDPVPVLMLTAAADPDSATRAWSDGVDYYMAKPFLADEVINVVNSVLRRTAKP
jgi:two-component system, OmpR family, response regulator MtrA